MMESCTDESAVPVSVIDPPSEGLAVRMSQLLISVATMTAAALTLEIHSH
jgi:hypothetical protein